MSDLIRRFKTKYRYSIVVFKELVKTDFQLRYQGSFLGVLWSVLKPLMLFCRHVHGFCPIPTILRRYSYICNFASVRHMLWSFFSEATTMGMQSIVNRGDLLRKVHFPSYIIVAATTMGSMISLGINLLVVVIFGFFSHAHYTWHVLLVPLNVLQLYVLALAISLLLGTLYVYFRDVSHIWDVVLQAMFYAIPVIYPLSMVSQYFPAVSKIMLLNPIAQTIMDVRHNLLSPEDIPTVWTWVGDPILSLIPYALTALLLWLGVHVFRKNSSKFAEVL